MKMLGRTESIFLLLLTSVFLTPIYANEETSTNNDNSITSNKIISPENNRIRSILRSDHSENEILSTIQPGNKALINQHGSENNSQIRQQGFANQAYTEQLGAENNAITSQKGQNNIADQYQTGIGNTVISIQRGNNNISRQIQQCNGINSHITQHGNNGLILICEGL